MNLLNYLSSIFRGQVFNGQLESVREAARQDAQAVAGAYVQEFEATVARILQGSQQRLIGDDTLDAEYEVAPDYATWDRPMLMRACRDRGISTEKTDRKHDLIDKLTA